MMFEAPRIQFKISDLFNGFAEARGLIHFAEDGIRIEYQVRDSLIGVLRSAIRDLVIPYDQIESIVFRKRWWRRSIEIQTSSLRIAAAIPGQSGATIRIKVQRHDRRRIEEAITHATLRMSEIRLERIENW
jgi:hypothetical protein